LRWARQEPERPFFLFLNYYDPHSPYVPPDRYREMFSRPAPSDTRYGIDAYDGEIAYVDEYIGRLVGELESSHFARPLLLIVTSDHGESFGDHGFHLHANALYLNEIHVPLIVRWPGTIPQGVRVDEPVTNAALPATMMDLVDGGIDHGEPPVFPGAPLTRLWTRHEPISGQAPRLAEIARQPFESYKNFPLYEGWMKSIVTSKWHYIEHQTLGSQLYDWRNDAQELNDLAKRPELQSVVEEFSVQLKTLDDERRRSDTRVARLHAAVTSRIPE